MLANTHCRRALCGGSTSSIRFAAVALIRLYEVVRDNLETLYGAIDDGSLAVRIPEARPQGAIGLSRLRAAVPRLRAPEVRGVPGEAAGGVQLRRPGLLPVVHGTTDSGGTWTARNAGVTYANAYALAIDPKNPATLYAVSADGVYRSTDSATTWSRASSGLGVAPTVNDVVLDAATSTTIHAGLNYGPACPGEPADEDVTSDLPAFGMEAGAGWTEGYRPTDWLLVAVYRLVD